MVRVVGGLVIVVAIGAGACSSYPAEGKLVEPGPGVTGIPGGPYGVSSLSARPISGGTLTTTGSTAIASDPDRGKVFIVDLETQRVDAVALEPDDEPGRSVVDEAGRVHVALRRGGAVATIDLLTRSLVQRREVCPAPRGVAYDAAEGLLHVACDTGELVSLPASGGSITRRIELGRDLRDVVVRGDSLVVSRFRSAELMVLDKEGQVVSSVRPPNSSASATAPTGFEPAVAWRTVAVSETEVAVVHERSNPNEISIGRAGYYQTSDPCAGGIVHGTVSILDPSSPAQTRASVALPLLVGASDVAISPDGSTVAVASSGNSWPADGTRLPSVLVMPVDDLQSGSPCELPGQEPVEGETTSVAFTDGGDLVVQSREPAQLQIIGGATIRLSEESIADTGVALFHMNSGFGVACASCHPEGRDDGRVWRFADIGPRRTQSAAGGLLATAPFHWSGDVADIPSLVHEVFVSRMGGPQPNSMQVEHFTQWLDSVPAPLPPILDENAVEAGRRLFEDASVGCAGCHSGAHLTNNASYDVGTGGVFQVPSLIGVGARAPFLHDGCAPTLEDRFSAVCNDGARHGVTAGLDQAELGHLVTYLESL